MAADEGRRQTQFVAKSPNFVFEELSQWLDELKAHLFRQAADVMVAFDGDGWAT